MDVKRVAQLICAAFSNSQRPVAIEFSDQDGAWTDGRVVCIGKSIVDSTDPNELIAVILHEAGHIRFTNFFAVQNLPNLVHLFTNAIEDARIERDIRMTYPGAKYTLDLDTVKTGYEQIPKLDKTDLVVLLANYVYAYLSVEDVNGLRAYLDAAQPVLKTYLGRHLYSLNNKLEEMSRNWPQSTVAAGQYAVAVVDLLKNYLSELANNQTDESVQGRSASSDACSSPTTALSDSDSDASSEAAQGSVAEKTRSKAIPADSGVKSGHSQDDKSGSPDTSDEKAGNTSTEGASRPTSGQPTGSALNPGSSKSETSSGESTPGQGFSSESGSSTQSCTDLQARRLAILKARDQFASNRSDESTPTQTEFDHSRKFERMQEATPQKVKKTKTAAGVLGNTGNVDSGKSLCERAELLSQSLGRALRSIVETTVKSHTHHSACGRRIDAKRLANAVTCDPRIFLRKGEENGIETAVMVLLDKSGSMASIGSKSVIAALSLTLALRRLSGVKAAFAAFPLGTVRFDQSNRCATWCKVVDFDVSPKQRYAALSHAAKSEGGTPIEEAITGATLDLLRRPESKKVILCITDGQFPSCDAALEARKVGIATACLSLNPRQDRKVIERSFDASAFIRPEDPLAPVMFRLAQALRPGCKR